MGTHSEARERVLLAAERLFAERGYAGVTVQDIAKGAGIHHASLYHHAREGKEGLFVEVMERVLRGHQAGIAEALARGEGDLRAQLRGVADWLVSQPPMDLIRMVHVDLPAISADRAAQLVALAYAAILLPLEGALEAAAARGAIRVVNIGTIAGGLFWAIEGLHTLPDEFLVMPRAMMAYELIDVFLAGLDAGRPAAP